MNKQETLAALNGETGFFRHWIGLYQRLVLIQLVQGEEGQFYVDLLTNLKTTIEEMPKTYETEDVQIKDKVVHLHYFGGTVDAWIVERDMGDQAGQVEIGPQHQAFGPVTLSAESIADSEWGYISIQDLIDNNIEIDLHWEPKTVKEVV